MATAPPGAPLTPERLQALRESLPAWGADDAPSPDVADYLDFYGLKFDPAENISYRIGMVRSGAYRVAVQSWLRPGASANLLLVHGYFDHVGLYGKLVAFGLARNCNVLAFDLPGHGLSSGKAAVIDDFSDYSRALHDVLATVILPQLPLWTMAQSTGCAALMDFARHYDWPFLATVMLAPLVRPRGWRRVRLGRYLLHRVRDSVPREFTKNSSDEDFLHFIQRDPLQCREVSMRWVGALGRWLSGLHHADLGVGPVLIIQGDADRTVHWRYNLKVVPRLFPGSRIEMLPGAGHQLANESEELRGRYLALVVSYLCEQGIQLAPPETAPAETSGVA